MHGRMPVIAEGDVAELQLRGHDTAQSTADQRSAISPADIASRCQADSRKIESATLAGG